jgi:hypothetical protein
MLTYSEALNKITQAEIQREMLIADFKYNLRALSPNPLSDAALEPYVKVMRTQLNSFIAVQYSDAMEALSRKENVA